MTPEKLKGLLEKKSVKIILVILALALTFFLVYSPHQTYKFPLHIDEWHHIDQSMKLTQGEYSGGSFAFRFGFHAILAILSLFANLLSVYQFLPAIWAVVSALTLFWVVKKKTNNFLIGLFSIIFFASIKSNVNILGLWFFTPLSFSIPFVFLFVHFFTEWLNTQNKKQLYASIGLSAFITIVYSISFLFTLYFFVPYLIIRRDLLIKNRKSLAYFILVFIIGIFLYSYFMKQNFLNAIGSLLQNLVFQKGWGVLERTNSFLEMYSLAGYIFAFLGVLFIFIREKTKKYLPYLLWPVMLLGAVFFFRMFDFSYLVPYQRNLYYFVFSMPLLSAYGLYFSLKFIKELIIGQKNSANREKLLVIILVPFLAFSFYFSFKEYYSVDRQISLYYPVSEDFYNSLLFLRSQPAGTVLSDPLQAIAIYPVTLNEPYTSLFFLNADKNNILQKFFGLKECESREKFMTLNNITYIISDKEVGCAFQKIYSSNEISIYRL